MINRSDVLALFARQHYVAGVSQLLAVGVSTSTIKRSCARGSVVRVLPGVLRMAHASETFLSRAMALQLHAGETSYVSGVSAGAIYGLRKMPIEPVEVTAEQQIRSKVPSWARLEWTSWAREGRDIVVRPDGLRVASPLLMLFRLARTFNDHRFERAAEDCWHLQLLTPEAAGAYLEEIRRSGRGGVLRFERWVVGACNRARPSQSGLELDVLDAIRRAGLPEPQRQHPLILRSGEEIHIDLAWPEIKLGLEPGHTWYHGGNLRMRADQARDRACDEIGWRIIRHDETLRDELPAFGLQLRIIYDDRLRTIAGR